MFNIVANWVRRADREAVTIRFRSAVVWHAQGGPVKVGWMQRSGTQQTSLAFNNGGLRLRTEL